MPIVPQFPSSDRMHWVGKGRLYPEKPFVDCWILTSLPCVNHVMPLQVSPVPFTAQL